jgi:starch phosphorylase
VGDKINADPEVGDLLKLVFLPDYNVSSAEVLIPATELSQHISTAGEPSNATRSLQLEQAARAASKKGGWPRRGAEAP